jgi:hypothetical protein
MRKVAFSTLETEVETILQLPQHLLAIGIARHKNVNPVKLRILVRRLAPQSVLIVPPIFPNRSRVLPVTSSSSANMICERLASFEEPRKFAMWLD